MLKYYDVALVFQEVPDEITIAINITGCPHHCCECHSPHLAEDCGVELTPDELSSIFNKFISYTCVCFMGGDNDHNAIVELCKYIKKNIPGLKCAMYSGDDEIDPNLCTILDYYKVGHYDKQLGGLNSAITNQRFYKILNGNLIDITNKFFKKENSYYGN